MSVPVTVSTIGEAANFPTFSVRNGRAAAAVPLFVRGSLPTQYHWCPIAGIPIAAVKANLGAFIRAHFAQIKTATPTVSDADAKVAAIILGTARVSQTVFYELVAADLSPGEVAQSVYTWDANTAQVVTAAGAPAAPLALAQNMPDFTLDEQSIFPVLMAVAVAIPALQGFSLAKTGHHYLSDAKSPSFKAFQAVEKQKFASVSAKAWIDANRDVYRDLMNHKSAHPIDIAFKKGLARNREFPATLRACDLGSAAVRLPVRDEAVEKAETYQALSSVVGTMVSAYGCSVDSSMIEELLALAEDCDARGAVPAQYSFGPKLGQYRAPQTLDEVLGLLSRCMDKNAGNFAWMYGYYCALLDHEEQTGGTVASTNSLKSAYSLKKLANTHAANFFEGREDYKDYRTFKASERAAGRLVSRVLVNDA